MNDVEKIFCEDLNRNIFSEAMADSDFDCVDSFDPDDDDYSSESEEI